MHGSVHLTRLHLAAAIIAIVALPLASWLDGSGQLAWTMFSRTGHYRLVLHAGGVQLNPTELAAASAPGGTSRALVGADRMKHHDVMRATLRRHLDDIARLACRLRPGVPRVAARLEERVRSTEPVRTTELTVTCDR